MTLPRTSFETEWIEEIPYAKLWPLFCWVSENNHPKNKTKQIAKQITSWTSCREQHINHLRRFLGINGWYKLPLCTHQTRFALKKTGVSGTKASEYGGICTVYDNKAMKTAEYVLNLIEKEAGWKLTTITKSRRSTMDLVGKKLIAHTYMVIGPAEWMNSVQLISLYLLIIRSCWFVDFFKIKKIEDIEEACKRIVNRTSRIYSLTQHIKFIKATYKYWLLLVLNKDFLIAGRSIKTLYRTNNMYGGITDLIFNKNSVDSITRKKWKELIKQYRKGNHGKL